MEVSWNFQKKASTVQDRSTKLKNELKNWKTKKLKKGVQTLVKLLMSEKSWNFKKKVSQVKKITNFWKLLQNCKKREIEKKQLKSKPNIKKLRRNLITILENFEKSLKGPKIANLEKSLNLKKIKKKKKTMFQKSQQNFEKFRLICKEFQKTEIKKGLNITENMNIFF